MERISDTTIRASEYGSGNIVIEQDTDTIIVRPSDIGAFVNAVRRCGVESAKSSLASARVKAKMASNMLAGLTETMGR